VASCWSACTRCGPNETPVLPLVRFVSRALNQRSSQLTWVASDPHRRSEPEPDKMVRSSGHTVDKKMGSTRENYERRSAATDVTPDMEYAGPGTDTQTAGRSFHG